MPVVLLLLFVDVFGGAHERRHSAASADRGEYIDYVVPGILLMTVGGTVAGTAMPSTPT